MELKNIDELKMMAKFRMYVKITGTPSTNICDESGITRPTFRTIMKDWSYIPQKRVRDKINLFMDHKLTELKELLNC